ncbi:MAG TPA: RNA polymerase sigma factor [Opitutaceae bacterium]
MMPRPDRRDSEMASAIEERLDALHRVALRLEHEPAAAADLVQEACMRAWTHRERARPHDLGPWLFCILRNVWIDRWRRLQRAPEFVELPPDAGADAEPPPRFDPQDAADRARLEQCFDDEVLAALDDLPEQERLSLLFHTFGDLSYHEISVALDCPLGTVMSRIHRARVRLRARLEEYAASHGIIPRHFNSSREDERDGHAQA